MLSTLRRPALWAILSILVALCAHPGAARPPLARAAMTLPQTDSCGEWRTFVGGGPTAF